TCHNTSDTTTPDAGNYATVPYTEACTACHDTTNPSAAVPVNHPLQATDAQCAGCHGYNIGTFGKELWADTGNAHAIPEALSAANYQFQLMGLAPVIVNAANPAGPKIPDPAAPCAKPTTTICT